MRIKVVVLSVVFLGMVVVPAAAQQKQTKQQKEAEKAKIRAARAVCATIGKVIQGAMDPVPFEMLKSARNFSQSSNQWVAYDSGLMLPGADNCVVFTDRESGQQSFLQCKYSRSVDENTPESALLDWEKQIITAINPCLPKDWKPIDDRRQHPAGYFLKGEGDPGVKIEFQLLPKVGVGRRELQVDFYSK